MCLHFLRNPNAGQVQDHWLFLYSTVYEPLPVEDFTCTLKSPTLGLISAARFGLLQRSLSNSIVTESSHSSQTPPMIANLVLVAGPTNTSGGSKHSIFSGSDLAVSILIYAGNNVIRSEY